MVGLSDADLRNMHDWADVLGEDLISLATATLATAYRNPEWFAYWGPRLAAPVHRPDEPDPELLAVEEMIMRRLPMQDDTL